MKITQKQLRKMIREALVKKLNESSDFTAKRIILQQAATTSMEFEKEIAARLNLVDADKLPPNLQRKYFEIATELQLAFAAAVKDAVSKFSTLPREESGNE